MNDKVNPPLRPSTPPQPQPKPPKFESGDAIVYERKTVPSLPLNVTIPIDQTIEDTLKNRELLTFNADKITLRITSCYGDSRYTFDIESIAVHRDVYTKELQLLILPKKVGL